ncbi:MAG TPA: beta-galactosidase GalB [Polyangiaceae bacterium]
MQGSPTQKPRRRSCFNHGFRFHRGDAPDAGTSLTYDAIKPWVMATGTDLISAGLSKPARPDGHPGTDVSFVRPDFDASSWREVDIPHDWGIEGPFSQELPGETGKLPWQGVGWYRKRFTLTESDLDGRLALLVDGAMAFSAFWLNGKFLGGWPYGYSSFRLELGAYAMAGENVLAVRLDNPPSSSRWYPGSGLYRNLWLESSGSMRVADWGVFVTTPHIMPEAALVKLDVRVENLTSSEVALAIETELYELRDGRPLGSPLAKSEPTELKVPGKAPALRTQCLGLQKPALWSLERRSRYVAITTLSVDGNVVDRVETPFGVRSIRFEPGRGFFLNDERVRMNGVCMHHDLGALGAALYPAALQRQLRILKEMGVNAIRTSHNPPAPELLELCDEMGFVVMLEAFDCWRRGKKHPPKLSPGDPGFRCFDYASVFDDWHERDLRAMVRRDRNHPSVVLYSIGNEVMEQWFSDGWELSTRLSGIVREEDRTRPITSGFNGEIAAYSGFQTAVDVVGFNYKPEAYGKLHKSNPTVAIVGSETASTISSRGEYFFPVSDDPSHGQVDFQVSSYDLSTPPWAFPPDREFEGLDRCPLVAGEFVWTGFDYLGEPTPYNSDATSLLNLSDEEARAKMALDLEKLGRISVPSRSSYFGIVDLAGFPKDRFYLYQARFRPDLRMAHILPHWNWPERVGQVTPVHVYSSADTAELYLNGRSLGRRRRGQYDYRFRWDDVVYEPGELRVETYRDGTAWATTVKKTTGPAIKLGVVADRATLRADGRDLAFVTVSVLDAEGLVVPRERAPIEFDVTEPGDLAAVDNGDPTSFESFQARERRAFNGLALVVLRARGGATGSFTLRAASEGLEPGEVTLHCRGG